MCVCAAFVIFEESLINTKCARNIAETRSWEFKTDIINMFIKYAIKFKIHLSVTHMSLLI